MKKIKPFLKLLRVFVLLFSVGFAVESAARPNILLILTDDQGYGDLSLHGNPHLKTPAMDGLARESVRLDRFYVSPVCAPTRASLLTGRYHLRTGVSGVTRREEVMDPAEVTLAELFQTAGYATGCFGKWHNGAVFPETPNGQGFDEFLGFLGGVTQRYFDPELNHNGKDQAYPGYITEVLADAAIDWMAGKAAEGEPFFCYVPFNAPHTPGLVEEKYWKPFYDKGVGRWESMIYGMIKVIDDQVARMLQFLEEKNLTENTIVIFMTDNGPATWRYNVGLRGKKSMVYDGGTRVPCFIRWTGKLQPHTVDAPLSHIDVLPTLADWCELGGTEALDLDGKSFAPLLENSTVAWPDRKLISFSQGDEARIQSTGAVHTNRWSAVMQKGRWELYDIVADVRQRDDLARTHPEVVRVLRNHFEHTLDAMPPWGHMIPVPLSASGASRVVLEGQDAQLPSGYKGKGIDYNFAGGISGNWISKWTDPAAVPEWPVKVLDAGRFRVSLQYCLPEGDRGVKAYFEMQGQRLPFEVTETFDPPAISQPFVLEGEDKKYESKPWRELSLGRISLAPGDAIARIRVTEIPGRAAMEVKGVVLERLP